MHFLWINRVAYATFSKTEDIYVWQPFPSEVYSTRSGYCTASKRLSDRSTQEQGDFSWIKDVWTSSCSPKMKVFLWSMIQKALPLGEQLQQRGIRADAFCYKCKGVESAMHIFFECPFAKEVWSLVPITQVVHLATCINLKDTIVAFRQVICLPPTGVSNNILPWICWAIWTARNMAIFENRTLSPNPQRRIHDPAESSRVMTCKTDAAFDSRTKRAGLAWIFTDTNGAHFDQGSRTHESINSPL